MSAAAIVIEAVFAAALTSIGVAFLRTLGFGRVASYALSFVAGVLLLIVCTVLLVAGGLPATPIDAVAGSVLLVFVVHLVARFARAQAADAARRGASIVRDATVAGLGAAALVVLALPHLDAVTYIKHVDSFEYLAVAGMLASQTLDEGVSLYQLQKRQLVVPALHAAAWYTDGFYLRSVTPAIAVSTLLFIVFVALAPLRMASNSRERTWLVPVVAAAIGVGILATNNRFVMHALYINGHLLFGLLTAIVAAGAWLVARRSVTSPSGWSAFAGLAMALLVVTRVDGFILATSLLVPILTASRLGLAFKAASLAGYGLGAVVWHGYLLHLDIGGIEVTGPLAIGAAAIAAIGLLPWISGWLAKRGAWLRGGYLIVLLAMLGLFIARDSSIAVQSWRAFVANAVAFDGYWGLGLVALAAVTTVGWLLMRCDDCELLSVPIVAFLPLAFLIAYLREGSYRVGGGDSLNRMLIQVVPLMVVFIVVSLQGTARWRRSAPRVASNHDAGEAPTA